MTEQNGPNKELLLRPGDIFLLVKQEPSGQIIVHGVIAQKVLAYGLLEAARDAIQEWHIRNQSQIVSATRLPGENPGL